MHHHKTKQDTPHTTHKQSTDRPRTTTRRSQRSVGAALASATLFAAAACTADTPHTAEDGTIHLKMADNYSLTHPVGKGGTQPFLDAMKAPGSPIHIDYFASGQLGKQADIPSIIRARIADIGVIAPSYVSSTFPLSSVGDLPGYGTDSCLISGALTELASPGGILYETELKQMKFRPLWIGVIPGYEAMTSNFDATQPKDFNGKVLRSTGGALDRVISHIGAAGVAMPIGDLYEALSRGTVEGTLASPISITPYGLEDVITDSTYGAEQGSFTFMYGINTDTWDELNQAQQDALTTAARASQHSVCTTLNNSREKSVAAMKEGGVRFHDVRGNPSAWQETSAPVLRNWIDAAEKEGKPAREVVTQFEAALAKQRSENNAQTHSAQQRPQEAQQ